MAVILLVASVCLLLSTRAFVSFDRIRVKVVQAPVAAQGGSVRITTDEVAELARLGQPAALIIHVASQGEQTGTLTVTVDGTTVCVAQLPRRAARRADCAVSEWGPADRHEIRIDGPDTPWALTYLEIATHHGNTGGPTTSSSCLAAPRTTSPLHSHSPGVTIVASAALLMFGLRRRSRGGGCLSIGR